MGALHTAAPVPSLEELGLLAGPLRAPTVFQETGSGSCLSQKMDRHHFHSVLLIKKPQNPPRFKGTPRLNGTSSKEFIATFNLPQWMEVEPFLQVVAEWGPASATTPMELGGSGADREKTSKVINSVCLVDASSPQTSLLDLQMLMFLLEFPETGH